MINIAGWIVWVLALIFAFGLLLSRNPDKGARQMVKNQGFIILVGVIATLFFPFSKLHLVWIVAISFFIPMLLAQFRIQKMKKRFGQILDESEKTDRPLEDLLEEEIKRMEK